MNVNEEGEKTQGGENRKKRVGQDKKEKTNSKREEDGNKNKAAEESAMLCNLEYLGLTKPTKN